MNRTITIKSRTITMHAARERRALYKGLSVIKETGALALITLMFITGSAICFRFDIPIKIVMDNYSYDVLVILIVMELFTNLIAETGIMQLMAVRIAELSKGQKRNCLILFGGLMFLISSFLNNITAVMMILPIVLVLLKSIEVNQKYIAVFFSVLLALSNTGGAASPVGDFPAIVIMTSGITSFAAYLTHAFPIFAVTSVVITVIWGLNIGREHDDGGLRELAVLNLKSQYKNIMVKYDVLKWLSAIFGGMFLAWSFVPQDIIPPEIIAILGYAAAMVICSVKNIRIKQIIDLKAVLTIASFLFCAQAVSQTGMLNTLAEFLQNSIHDPKLLVLVLMVITSLIAGVFSAGPAAAAMMPVITEICEGPLSSRADWIAVAYAAAICAGSSLFMWSATAGFILSGKVNSAEIEVENEGTIIWGTRQYLKYGLVNYVVQLAIALVIMFFVL